MRGRSRRRRRADRSRSPPSRGARAPVRRGARRRLHRGRRRRRRGSEAHHRASEHLDFEAGIGRRDRPDERRRRAVVDQRRRHLLGAAVRNVDVDRAGLGALLEARAELVALVAVEEHVGDLADHALDRGARQADAVFGPVGFHDAERRLLDGEHEADVHPELAHRVPGLLRRGLDDEPALGAAANDARVRHRIDCDPFDGLRAVRSARRGRTRSTRCSDRRTGASSGRAATRAPARGISDL